MANPPLTVQEQLDQSAGYFVEDALATKELYLANTNLSHFNVDLLDTGVKVLSPADLPETDLLSRAFLQSESAAETSWSLVVVDCSVGFGPPERRWDRKFNQPTGQLRIAQDSIRIAIDPIVRVIWVMDRPSRSVLAFVPSLRELPRWWFATPLRLGLSWIADTAGYEFVHGAAIGKSGTGLVLAGPSGVGKSTLSLKFSLAGWDFLADDFFLVDGLMAASVYRRVKLNTDSLSELGFEPLAEFAELSGSPKSVIDVTTLDRVVTVPRLAIRGVAMPSVSKFSGIQAVTQSKAFMELAPATLAGLQGGSSQSFTRLARIIQGCKLGTFGVIGPVPEISRELEEAMLTA